jgi:hypothetical protein
MKRRTMLSLLAALLCGSVWVAVYADGPLAGGAAEYDPLYDVAAPYNAIDVVDLQQVAARWGASGLYHPSYWHTTGNAGTNPALSFLGTTDNVTLTLGINNLPVLRFVPRSESPSIIAGYAGNSLGPAAYAAVIAGGGFAGAPNALQGEYATISGGADNLITSGGQGAVIAGGRDNRVVGPFSNVGGGLSNVLSGTISVIAGGSANEAAGSLASIGGGGNNIASGSYATIPGGGVNEASGMYSFAAGQGAKASHRGSFVWSDSFGSSYSTSSARTDQFLVVAAGGADFLSRNGSYAMRVENTDYGGPTENGDGLQAWAATSRGDNYAALYARNTGTSPGLYAFSTGTNAAYFAGNILVTGNCTGCALAYIAVNAGQEPLEVGDVVAASGVAAPLAGGADSLWQVRRADASSEAVVGVVQGRAALETHTRDGVETVSAAQSQGQVLPGEHLFIIVYGQTQVKVEPGAKVQPNQRLALGSLPGTARTLSRQTMTVADLATAFGIALAPADEKTGLVPVLVTLH